MSRTKRRTQAFVLGGGGARGALQVGALRALLEAGLRPDLLVGTSVGAVNATYLAVRGFTPESLAGLREAWHDAAAADLLPSHYLWLTVRTLFNRTGTEMEHHVRDFFVDHGLDPDLRFGQLEGPRLILVATDLKAGCVALYGSDPDQRVLEGLLASTTLPPWMRPLALDDRLLMDGGVVSNLPIEPATAQGATDIVALDLADPRTVGQVTTHRFGLFLAQLVNTMEQRQTELEKQVAAARGAVVHHVRLRAEPPLAVWEFPRAGALFEPGYALMQRYLAEHPELSGPTAPVQGRWWRRLWKQGA